MRLLSLFVAVVVVCSSLECGAARTNIPIIDEDGLRDIIRESVKEGFLAGMKAAANEEYGLDFAKHSRALKTPNSNEFVGKKKMMTTDPPEGALALCPYGDHAQVALVFASESDCNGYSSVIAAGGTGPLSYAYPNCTASTYCFSTNNALTIGSLADHSIVGVASSCVQTFQAVMVSEDACTQQFPLFHASSYNKLLDNCTQSALEWTTNGVSSFTVMAGSNVAPTLLQINSITVQSPSRC